MGARLSSGTPQADGMTATPAPLPRHQHGGSPSHHPGFNSRDAQAGPLPGARTRPRSIGGAEVFREHDSALARARRRDSNPRDSLGSSDSDEEPPQRSRHHRHGRRHHQLPPSIPISFYRADIKCPVCNKMVPQDEIEIHLIMCLNKPRVNYNEDVLTEDKGECAICLDDLEHGDTIARLPCLCIYHKSCIDEWFKRSRTCPEHPGEE